MSTSLKHTTARRARTHTKTGRKTERKKRDDRHTNIGTNEGNTAT